MLHIIANPASQSGSSSLRIRKLLKHLKKEGINAALHTTTHRGHAGELVKSLQLTEKDRLLLVGGDGSMNELINGMEIPYRVPLLLYPSGSGNDFARGMKISHNPDDLIARLKQNNGSAGTAVSEKIDLGEVTSISADDSYFPPRKGHRFAVSCGFGLDAMICHYLETGNLKSICNRLHIGKLSYLIVGIKTLVLNNRAKRADITVDADGRTLHFKKTVFVAVHNLPYEGGGFPFAPKASPKDGFLDVCIVHVPTRLHTLPLLVACLLGGRHTLFKRYVTSLQCRSITVKADRPMALHTDGEVILGQTGFTAKALENVITYG